MPTKRIFSGVKTKALRTGHKYDVLHRVNNRTGSHFIEKLIHIYVANHFHRFTCVTPCSKEKNRKTRCDTSKSHSTIAHIFCYTLWLLNNHNYTIMICAVHIFPTDNSTKPNAIRFATTSEKKTFHSFDVCVRPLCETLAKLTIMMKIYGIFVLLTTQSNTHDTVLMMMMISMLNAFISFGSSCDYFMLSHHFKRTCNTSIKTAKSHRRESETRLLGQYMMKCRSVNASGDIETALRYHRFSQIRIVDKKMREANGKRKRKSNQL